MNLLKIKDKIIEVLGINVKATRDSGTTKVSVDGKTVYEGNDTELTITWVGDLANLDCTSAIVNGDVNGNIDCTSIKCNDVGGKIDATSVRCRDIKGDVDSSDVNAITITGNVYL